MPERVLALTVDGELSFCVCPPELRGKGRCNHVMHQKPGESVEAFLERVTAKTDKDSRDAEEVKPDHKEITQEDIDTMALEIDKIAGVHVTMDNWKDVMSSLSPQQVAEINNIAFEAAPEFSLPIRSEEYEEAVIENQLYFANLPAYGIGGTMDALSQMFKKVGPTISDRGLQNIEHSYAQGLTPAEYFLRQFSTRDASIAKSVSTAKPGYCIYEDSVVDILNENGDIETCKWKDVEVGMIFANNSICTEIQDWKRDRCYEIKMEGCNPIVVTHDHLVSGRLAIAGRVITELEKSSIARRAIGETNPEWICAQDIFDFMSIGAVFESNTGVDILSIKPFKNFTPVKVRCISTTLGYYETNGLFHHNTARKLFYCMSGMRVFEDCGGPHIDVLHCKAPDGHICQKCANAVHGGEKVKANDMIGGMVSTNMLEPVYQLSMKQKHMGTLETSAQQAETKVIMATLDGWGTSPIIEQMRAASTTEEARDILYRGLTDLYKSAKVKEDPFNIQAVARFLTSYKRTENGVVPIQPGEKCDIVSMAAVGNAHNIFKIAELGTGYKALTKPREDILEPDAANAILN